MKKILIYSLNIALFLASCFLFYRSRESDTQTKSPLTNFEAQAFDVVICNSDFEAKLAQMPPGETIPEFFTAEFRKRKSGDYQVVLEGIGAADNKRYVLFSYRHQATDRFKHFEMWVFSGTES